MWLLNLEFLWMNYKVTLKCHKNFIGTTRIIRKFLINLLDSLLNYILTEHKRDDNNIGLWIGEYQCHKKYL